MGAGKRLVKFGSGGLLGAGVGTAVAILFAPQSGDELTGRVLDRIRQARLAGAEAKVAKEEELIRRFRGDVNDPGALRDEEVKAQAEAAEEVAAIGRMTRTPDPVVATRPVAVVDPAPAAGAGARPVSGPGTAEASPPGDR
jgi:gas vesicle protein